MFRWSIALFLACTVAFAGCGKSSSNENEALTLQLNWKPEPEFGGFYAADYAGAGLKVNVAPGGAGAPTIELLGAGKVQFAIVSADEIPKARQQGIKVVALFAAYQTHPQALMTQAKRGFKTIDDVFKEPGTLAIEAGLPHSDFLKSKYGFDKLKVVPSPFGDLSVLRTEDKYTMQCFYFAEPLAAKKAGLDVTTFLIADSGYNPYASVLATTDDFAKSHPDVVKKMTESVKAGWENYLKDPSKTNEAMHALNPTMEAEVFAATAEAQKPLIEDAETAKNGLGTMSDDRWTSLIKQLKELKVITADITASECYLKTK
ncbi:MAG: ABC transporter substrate-binding protein [Tepidisphaeraceae bacterium]